ncbi:MAG: XisI protein [Symploca sp. SIO3C6]|uniref:XisI protein n=1 Tax=Symploca sp. SIO1C4 TaxID=2607765 RepID=A0A6B3N6H3_9CYAN|nr:XisI protein [Symploca sp. SIO3C6]NER27200.1 XisI protein [Symploca sp. SIO1C4]NET04672.1 XisI protein [Symploca sp. SIO2B6]
MDTLTQYRQHIENLLNENARHVWDARIQAMTIFDVKHDHYQLVYVGWQGSKRIYGVVLHLDIIDGKIWIQQDGTEIGIANQLVDLGVPKQDIVLGFDPPNLRKYTDFALS